MSHLYVGIENLGLTGAQKQTLFAAIRQLGPLSHPQPSHLNHGRVRLDANALIVEALFDEDTITIEGVKGYLASILGVDPATISHTVTQTAYGPLVTFSRNGDKLRLIQFGGVSPTWMESGDACRAYLKANISEWEAAL